MSELIIGSCTALVLHPCVGVLIVAMILVISDKIIKSFYLLIAKVQ